MRKYRGNYKGKLPNGIHKHTKVRRPESPHRIGIAHYITYTSEPDLVQDIKRELENPINVEAVAVDLMFKDYYNNVVLTEEFKPKPLLERITNKLRRKK